MRNKKIYIAILNQGDVRPELADLISKLGNQQKYELFITYPANKPITNNRNRIVKRFLETDSDYLLMIDGDNIPPLDIIEMADYDKDIIGGLCFGFMKQRIIPFAMEMNDRGTYDMAEVNQGDGVMEVDAVGSGVMMIKRNVLERIPFPFRNEYDVEGIKIMGLDFNFCKRAKELGFKIYCDVNRPCSHWTITDLRLIWETFDIMMKQVKNDKEK